MAKQTYVIRGTLDWAKIVGPPVFNKFSEVKEWSFDLTPDAAGMKAVVKQGIKNKLRDPKENEKRKEQFLTFRQKDHYIDKATGERKELEPIPITDIQGRPWPKDVKIGNGSIADVKYTVQDYAPGKPKGVYVAAVRVLKLVPYEGGGFTELSEDDEFFGTESPISSTAPVSGDDYEPDFSGPDDDEDIPF